MWENKRDLGKSIIGEYREDDMEGNVAGKMIWRVMSKYCDTQVPGATRLQLPRTLTSIITPEPE